MPNLYDYLKWRGDITIKQAPINIIDAMILSRISYLPFCGIVPESFKEKISMAAANEALQADASAHYIMQADRDLLPSVAACPRFSSMRLSGFVNSIDNTQQKQFSAMVVEPGDGTSFVSYRGTDDSLIGWKEDFNMSFMKEVPAQLEAVAYLEAAAASLRGKFLLVGHSKGGNLAAYAGAFCKPKTQKRIMGIYNFDGPGFHAETMAQPGYVAIRDKISTIVPQSSVVGLLLEHEEDFSIISSSQMSFSQHDLYSWEVMAADFIYLDTMTSSSHFVDSTIRCWLAEMSTEERSAFIEGLFSIINATNSNNLKELTAKKWYEHARASLTAIINLDDHTRMVLGKTIGALMGAAKDNLHIFLPFLEKKRGAKKTGEK